MTAGAPVPPRLAPRRELPPYSFISPRWPHPINAPGGHMQGRPPHEPPPLDPAAWARSEDYVYGFDLFNHGYYWEAHEAWEGLWNAAGREGAVAEFLKGFIKLAAAGVKVRQGQPRGVRIHAERAEAHFAAVAAGTGTPRFGGFALADLQAYARDLGERADGLRGDADLPVEVVLGPLIPR